VLEASRASTRVGSRRIRCAAVRPEFLDTSELSFVLEISGSEAAGAAAIVPAEALSEGAITVPAAACSTLTASSRTTQSDAVASLEAARSPPRAVAPLAS